MSVARTYAKALYEAASETKSPADISKTCDDIEKRLDQLLETLRGSREMNVALTAPLTTSREKAALMSQLSEKMGMPVLLGRFLHILATKGRLNILSEVREALAQVRLEAEGGVAGTVVSAQELGDGDVAGLATAFSRKLGKKVEFRASIDPTLLAGVRVTVGGVTYDGTLRSQLEQLRDKFVNAAAEV